MSTTTATTTTATEATVSKLVVVHDLSVHPPDYKYAAYLPVRDEETFYPPLKPFEFTDRGLSGDKEYRNLLSTEKNPRLKVTQLTPVVGTEIRGLQLSELDDRQKDDLALLLAKRGVVVFRDQDFKDIGPQKQKDFAAHFGPLHVHATGSHVKDHPELLNIYLGPDNPDRWQERNGHLTSTWFHSDITFERQPPGVTILTLLTVPPTGGDTSWTSQVAAFNRLSKPMQAFLETLRAEHTGHLQSDGARRSGTFVRRAPTTAQHPVVRVHPVTGEKSLFVNSSFTTRIVGLKREESDALLNLLFAHIAQGQDFQVRVKWEEDTVCLWDNRNTCHTAISDYSIENPQEGIRHGFRLTAQADQPVGVNGLEGIIP